MTELDDNFPGGLSKPAYAESQSEHDHGAKLHFASPKKALS
jgi:hypothetical protein